MRLISVELRNFKSFGKDPEAVDFEPGLNILSGPNGVGKSSVLEAVGLVLFQRTAPNLTMKSFAHLGGGSWSVAVTFEAVDKLVYRVERSERRYVLFEAGKEEELAAGVGPVSERLCDLTGVDPDMPPAEFFQRVLCSGQGEYTRDLELPAGERRRLYDPLFKVDRFKALDANLAQVSGRNQLVRERTLELEKRVGILRERYAGLKEARARKEEREKELRRRLAERDETAQELQEARQKVAAMAERQARVQQLRQALALDEERARSLRQRLEDCRGRVDEAEKAAARRAEHRPRAEEFERAAQGLKDLEPRRRELLREREAYQELLRQQRSTEERLVELRESRQAREQRVRTGRDEYEELVTSLRRVREELEEAGSRRSRLEASAEPLSRSRDEARDAVREAERVLAELVAAEGRLEDRRARLERLEQEARRADERRQEQGRIPQLEQGLERLRDRLSAAQAQIELIEREKKILEIGQCPFVGVTCLGIEGRSISDEVERMLAQLHTQRLETDREIEEYQLWLEKAQGAERELAEAEAAATQARELRDEVEEEERRIRTRLDEVCPSRVAEGLLRMAMNLDDLGDAPDVELRGRLEQHHGRSVVLPSRAEAPLEELSRLYQRLEERSREAEKDLELRRRRVSELDGRRTSLEASLEASQRSLSDDESSLRRLEHELEDLEDKRRKLVREAERQESALVRLRELEEEEARLLETRERTEEDHRQYDRLETMALELEGRREQLAELVSESSSREERIQSERRRLDEAVRELGDEEAARHLESRRDQLTSRESELTNQLKNDREALEQLVGVIEQMAGARQEARRLQREIDTYHQAGKLLMGIRRVFQNAAPKLAQRYLDEVSREATRGYRSLAPRDTAEIRWHEDYQVELRGRFGDGEAVAAKDFSMLSGGEQMAVAVALKLALARVFSRCRVLFLDEPTIHLDVQRRENLAQHLTRTSETLGFEQLVVISHDATFDATHQHAVRLVKDDGISRVERR